MAFFDLGVKKSAILSKDRKYRYYLLRSWDPSKTMLVFVGLNPSVADENEDDATVRWLKGYAHEHGYGSVAIVNLFAFRATDPSEMLAARFPIQEPDTSNNDHAILTACTTTKCIVVCGWGRHGSYLSRDRVALRLFHQHAIKPHALAFNKDGSPHHPLRLSHKARPVEMGFRE